MIQGVEGLITLPKDFISEQCTHCSDALVDGVYEIRSNILVPFV